MSICPPVSDCLMALVQASAETALTDSVAIRRQTATAADGAGHLKPSSGTGWTTIATVAGLLTESRLSPRERALSLQTVAPVAYDVYVPHGTDVKPTDQLVINTRTFEVQGVSSTGDWAILDRVFAVELQ